MGLKARKIKTMIEEHADECMRDLNSKLGTSFELNVDWECLPPDIDSWGWGDEELKTCFYNSYFYPVEEAFAEMFKDPMYKEAISEQITTLKLQGGDYSMASDFSEGVFVYKHIMSTKQKNIKGNEAFNKTVIERISHTIDKKLS